jgi:tRNA (guanine-N7-)-methyltransferase
MNEARLNIVKSREIRRPTYYVEALLGEYSQYSYDEVRAEVNKGQWRELAFQASPEQPLDLEIGTGVGYFFAEQAIRQPARLLLGIELKFKPLIQTIRRALSKGAKNAKVIRYHARHIENLFASQEIDNIYIHHPDPWTKRSKQKHRLMNSVFLNRLSRLQRPGRFLDFKTDNRDYFFWVQEELKKTNYKVIRYTEDLHKSEWQNENVITQFEQFFLNDGLPIYYLQAINS